MNGALEILVMQTIGALRSRMIQFCVIVPPVFFSILLVFLFGGASDGFVTSQAAVGASLLSIWSVLVFTALADIDTEKVDGTLSPTFVAPTHFEITLAIKSVGHLGAALCTAPIAFMTCYILIGVSPRFADPGSALVGFVTFCISATSFAIVLGSCIALTRSARILMNFVEYPIYILSGIVIPIASLPGWLRDLGLLLPFSYTTKLIWLGIVESAPETGQTTILAAAAAAGASAACAMFLLKIIAKRIRVVGRLDLA